MAQNHARVIETRKKADAQYKVMESARQEHRKIMQIASFENKTAVRIDRNTRTQMLDQRRQQFDVELYERRRALADLYNEEMQGWRTQVMETVETMEVRKARIMDRAYALRDAREEARQKLVEQKYDLQWRDACDDARTLDSKALTHFMNEERKKQIEDKLVTKSALSANENGFLAEWNRQLDDIAQRERTKEEKKKAITMETNEYIKDQIRKNEIKREEYLDRLRIEEEAELSRLRELIDADSAKERKILEDARERGKHTRDLNAYDQAIKDSESGVEKDRDKILLDYALRKEAEKETEERAKYLHQKDAAKQYQKYLEELMVKESEDTAFVDEINKQAELKVWKARDDALQARQDARDHLMHMVDDGRQEQIRERREAEIAEREHEKQYSSNFIIKAKESIAKETADAYNRRKVNMDNNEELMKQINYRKYKEELEKQEVYLEDKRMRYVERQHQARLAVQGGAVRTHRPKIHTDLSH